MSHAVLGLSPLGVADPRLAAAVTRGGGLGVLELGSGDTGARAALSRVAELAGRFGVRVPAGCGLTPADVTGAELVVLAKGATWPVAGLAPARVLVEVTSLGEARQAAADGAHGLVAADGELTSFVLLQQLLAAQDLPVWVRDGIGPRTAAGAFAMGAAGVVLDDQLGLLPECDLPPARRDRLDQERAGLFAERYGTAEDAVRDLVLARAGRGADPYAQGAPLRRTLGVEHAVAQGPMTRVSDQPGFAAAVAEQGGMPFVAVALADGERTAELLHRTAGALGDRPWGAGILGFVPEELRAEQLAAIRAVRPRSVLIAGGRPAQAKALEAEGIATYLHVPSPILLGQYLAAGVRRFVFEGSECGGHIGPRTSFALWEAQLAVLERFAAEHGGDGVEVFFAGGVHDATSAAAVAAMAAPLADTGAGVGVLMGTAYLFTEEAVRHGAITGLFQREAVRAERTATLETAPGHLTRCLHSPFVDEFAAVAAGLESVPARERWQRLEELNTGRLRIASKGIRRDGGELVAVDEAGQLADGMFMAGQVAVLRGGTTDIASLHHAVTEGAAGLLRATPDQRHEPEPLAEPADVAIVGMACVFPGAPDLPAFWSNVLRGVDSVTEVPPDRWDPDVYYRADGAPGSTPSKWGGFIDPVPFDPMSFGIPPASMGSIDPAQLLSLEVARRALGDAGYADRPFDRERAAVIFGAEAGGDLANAGVLRALLPGYTGEVPDELELPTFTEDSFPGTLANVISGRIANRLDLGGANYTVDAACGSSLAALDLACKELTQATSDLVLCGAVDLHNGINDYLMFASAGALSPTGRCRPFDRAGDGIALGEGVACLVLKRLADAERDGDRIYAVVKGVGAASDGRSLGLTAPRPEGQYRALERAYRGSGVSPAQVGLVEAHGTGTVVGDGTELSTLTSFFDAAGARPGGCALGSVKSQIGHTKCAAGLAGLIKAALSLWFGVLPPTLHLTEPIAAWDRRTSPFTFGTGVRPWAGPRAAGVSAFGFGGTNFHAVLAEGPSATLDRHGHRDWPCELFLFPDREAMAELLDLAADERLSLAGLATAAAERPGATAAAIVAGDRAELVAALRAALAGEAGPNTFLADPGADPGAVAFVFPGQGSQRAGMLAELFSTFPDLRRYVDTDLAGLAFPPAAFDPAVAAEQDEALRDTRIAQPALGMAAAAVTELLGNLGIRPGLLAGHSYGELVALATAGAFDHATLMRLSGLRARCILDAAGADPGAMAAVKADRDTVLGAVPDGVVLANHNAPDQVVISGPAGLVDAAVERLRARSVAAKRIPVACAFHSPLVAGAATAFADVLDRAEIRDPLLPVWANRTARPYPAGGVRAELAAQLGSPVRFAEQIEDMYAAGARTFVEAGPGSVLTGLVGRILGDRPHTAVAPGSGGLRGLLTAVARLAVAGVDVHAGWLVRGRTGPPAEPAPWTVDGQLVRRATGELPEGGLAPARRVQGWSMGDPATERNQVVVDFLRTNRELIAAQRDVLLGYLSGGAAPPAPVPQAAPVAVEPAAAPVAAEPESPEESEVDVLGAVIGVISERTGYPADMIDGELDLEADLSVDSIKRTEIAGTLITRLGLAGRVADAEQDELGRRRTANTMAAWLAGQLGAEPEPEADPGPAAAEPAPTGVAPRRFVLRAVPAAEPAGAADLTGRRIRIVHEPGQHAPAAELRAVLDRYGASTGEDADTVLLLGALSEGDEPAAPQVFVALRDALAAGARTLLVAAPRTAPHAAGLRGLVRALAREREDVTARLVELERLDPAAVADALVYELLAADDAPVVLRDGGGRQAFELAAAELDPIAFTGAGPAGPGSAEAQAIGLDGDSVVLLLGGARGITARFARTLAQASGCRIELAGRTPGPAQPVEDVPAGLDAHELRGALAAKGHPLAEVERTVRSVLAQREVAATMEAVRAAGGAVNYRQLDVRDGAAVRQLVKDVYTKHGRLDGVVHAAGVLDDKLVEDKDEGSFRTVFGTKVDGAQALLDALGQLAVRPAFVTFFGSIAAVLGNRGQTDYAAANDALETIGTAWAGHTGARVLTVHWGPWAPSAEHGGMVSGELARSYDRRGVRLIDPDEGTTCLLRELAYGDPAVRSVVYTASVW